MKKVFLKLSLAALTGITMLTNISCTKLLPKDLSFNMDGSEFTITVPPQSYKGEVTFTNQNADINVDSAIRAHTQEIYGLKSVKLTSIQLNIVTPPDQTFDPIQNVEGYISTASMPEMQVAHKEGVPKGIRTLNLDVNDVELAPYLKQDPQFKLKGTVTQSTAQPIEVHVKSTYHVVAEKAQ